MTSSPPPTPPAIHCRHFTDNPMCKPLPGHPSISPYSAAWVAEEAQPGRPVGIAPLNVWLDPKPLDHLDTAFPVYRLREDTDAITHVVHCTGVPYSAFTCAKTQMSGMQIRIPRGAFPQGNEDHHLTIEDETNRRELDFWGASVPSDQPGSPFDVLTAGQCAFDGDGTGCSGSTATQIATSLGAIDPRALATAESNPHGTLPSAIATSLLCASPDFVYPAKYSDGANTNATPACREALRPNGRPPEGVRYFLDMSDAEINATPNAAYDKVILRTLDREHYGGTITDTDWSGSPGFAFGFLRTGWEALAREGVVPTSGLHPLPITSDGIDLAPKLRFCTNGTC